MSIMWNNELDDLACDTDFLKRVKDGVRWVQVPDPAEIDVRKIGTFDVVVAAQPQVLSRMPDLAGFLAHAHTAVRAWRCSDSRIH